MTQNQLLGTIHKKSVQPFFVILTPSSPILAVHQMAMFDQFISNFDLFFDQLLTPSLFNVDNYCELPLQ